MKPLLFLPLAIAVAHAEDDKLLTADLKKLADPAQRQAEVARLAECDGLEKVLQAYRLLEAPQKDGPPLLVLTAEYGLHFTSSVTPGEDGYAIDKPEELFGKEETKSADADGGASAPRRGVPVGSTTPDLERFPQSLLLVFDPAGKEIRPFDGNNLIDGGYIYDLNRDGILDRADSPNYGVEGADDQSVEVFELESFEAESRMQLRVIFNWHPRSADDANDWTYTCFDDNDDGVAEIGFGPENAKSDEERRRFVFRWDAATKAYSAGGIPLNSHIRVVTPGQSLEDIAKAGGLGYPLLKKGDEEESPAPEPAPGKDPKAPVIAKGKPYNFRSLKDASDADMLAFFRGRERRDSLDAPEDAVPNQVPEGFWTMAPKQAALALADINRATGHRAKRKLAVDDRGGISPPESGWYVYHWGSSSCYSYSSHACSLRFGKEQCWLLESDYNSNGVVGQNPLADQAGHTARVIPLSQDEARFLASTLFWLDRVRSEGDKSGSSSMGFSTADGNGALHLLADGEAAREVATETVWATNAVSDRWSGDYTPEVFINLVEYFLGEALPAHLGKRWEVAPEIDQRSLVTPLEKRLEPRLDDSARKQLTGNLQEAFKRHWVDPVPASAIVRLVECIGEEALIDLRPDLEKLKTTLPAENAEDKEFGALEKRFSFDHFGNAERDDPDKHPKDYKRYQDLIEKRRFKPGPVLREPLAATLRKLDLASDPKRLEKEADANNELSLWALDRLRKSFPQAWQDYLVVRFREGNLEARRNLFDTLATAFPEGGKALVDLMTPKEQAELIIEITASEVKAAPERAANRGPALLEMIAERKEDYLRRGKAMDLLPKIKLSEEQNAKAIELLLKEIKDPHTGEYGLNTSATAVDALSRLPGAAEHIDAIVATGKGGIHSFDTGLGALERLTTGRADRTERLEAYVAPCLEEHIGFMNDVFLAALAFDLRGLKPAISNHATEGPDIVDGDGADYSGGNFKGPAGQRYHAGREVLALWSEEDAATLGRMWIALAAARTHQFDPQWRGDAGASRALREKAAAAIARLPEDQRQNHLDGILAALPGETERMQARAVIEPLAGLAKGE